MPTPERSRIVICAGSHLSWRSRDSAMPLGLTLRRWNEAAGWPAGGGRADESSQARSPTTKCQTNLVFAVTPASFWCAACGAKESWPVSRLIFLLAGRSLAATWFWASTIGDCLDSLRLRNVRSGSGTFEADAEGKWSGCKAGESGSCAGRTVRILGARHAVQVSVL